VHPFFWPLFVAEPVPVVIIWPVCLQYVGVRGWTLTEIYGKVETFNQSPSIDGFVRDVPGVAILNSMPVSSNPNVAFYLPAT
jgi:hypothetical protein